MAKEQKKKLPSHQQMAQEKEIKHWERYNLTELRKSIQDSLHFYAKLFFKRDLPNLTKREKHQLLNIVWDRELGELRDYMTGGRFRPFFKDAVRGEWEKIRRK